MLSIKLENLAIDHLKPRKIAYSYPLLFIHGAGGTSKCWENYLQYFADDGWEVFALNLRGHFPSDRDEALAQVTLEDYLDDVEKVILGLHIEHCALIGHSLGGLLAQKTAENTGSLKALVSIAGAPPMGIAMEMNTDLPYPEAILNTMWGMMNMKPVKLTFMMAQQSVLNNIVPKEQKKIFNSFVAESLVVGYQVAQGYPVNPSEIMCPKLVIGCAKDVVAPPGMQQSIAEFLQADYIVYKQFAHLPMLEKGWEKSAEGIRDWLRLKVLE